MEKLINLFSFRLHIFKKAYFPFIEYLLYALELCKTQFTDSSI